MLLLILFAFVAGGATALSPCVLPVLPVALSAGVTGGRRRPLGIVTGLALAFAFATVALVYVIAALGLPGSLLRTLAIVVLILFGATLLVPSLAERVEAPLGRLTARARLREASGFWSGLLLGGVLGFVYAPCAGPILAGVITVSASQTFTAGRLAVALAYAIGASAALYVLMLAGRRLTGRLARRSGRFQMTTGAVMLVVAVAMLAGYDTRFETAIAADLPSFLVDPSKGVESSGGTAAALAKVRGTHVTRAGGVAQARRSATLPVLAPQTPELAGGGRWFNTPGGRALTLARLRGRVVLVDFWTYSCINCLRTLPYLKAWDARYRSKGLTIVGVHTPEFPFEKSSSNVAAAVRDDGIRYPVVQDNDHAIWDAYSNQYWPAEYLIDARGRLRLVHFGEGDYTAKENAIRSLLAEAGATRLGAAAQMRSNEPSYAITPESYLGAAEGQRFVNGLLSAGAHDFGTLPAKPPLPVSFLRYGGRWRLTGPSADALGGARLALRFQARRVFLVAGSPGSERPVRVLLDGHPLPARLSGGDVRGSTLRVGFQRLYRLVNLPQPATHTLTLEFAPGVRGYSFTFG